jgi:MinD superfamily P-loop ATPase
MVVAERCTGCGSCVDACGPRSLAMVDGIAVLAFPETCGSEEHCISACRDEAMQMTWLPFSGDARTDEWRHEIDQGESLNRCRTSGSDAATG